MAFQVATEEATSWEFDAVSSGPQTRTPVRWVWHSQRMHAGSGFLFESGCPPDRPPAVACCATPPSGAHPR